MLAVGTQFNTIQLWNIISNEFIFYREFATAKSDEIYINSIAQLNNGVICTGSDVTIKLWDENTGDLLNTLQGHTNCDKLYGHNHYHLFYRTIQLI